MEFEHFSQMLLMMKTSMNMWKLVGCVLELDYGMLQFILLLLYHALMRNLINKGS